MAGEGLTTGTETKPGVKTTEFGATVGTVILAAIQLVADPAHVSDGKTVTASVAVIVAYIISRGLAKLAVKPS